nr:hypothetical protein [uncultured Psychroserpens sp.]
MKTIITTIVFAFLCINIQGQEFEKHSNGLIYNDNTIEQLKFIVDSLNLKFKACEITETYHAIPQTKAIQFNLESGNIKQAKKDLENGMSLDLLKKTYPLANITKPKLIIAYDYTDYNDKTITHVSTKTIGEDYDKIIEFEAQIDITESYRKGDWIVDYNNGSNYRNEHVTAFYLLEDFKKNKLKDIYAEMVQYSHCMIDTTSSKIIDGAEHGYLEDLSSDYSKLTLTEKKELLDTFRHTKVIGTCSMDSSPRVHALNIAKLSAETVNWEVFLKAHLDVMNDRFERATDGSYAWAARKTYLKELEVLDINTLDLLLGITFRIDNASKNHYYGSIGRLGRALSESENQIIFEKTMLNMIKNDELDDYNRYIVYYLYDNYLYHLNDCKDKTERKMHINNVKAQLKEIQKFLPNHLIDHS